MKKTFLSVSLLAASAIMLSSVAVGATVVCDTGAINDVTVAGASCTEGNLLFSNFSVSASGFIVQPVVGIGNAGAGTGVVGSEVLLGFELAGVGAGSTANGVGDILLQYEATGGIAGVDISLQATPLVSGGSITITEVVCTVAFVGNSCGGTTLANIFVTSSGQAATASAFFATTTPVFIKKDISFINATTSEFTNSQLTPEPMTFSLMGAGLLGLGIFGRRRFKK